jgi:integrase
MPIRRLVPPHELPRLLAQLNDRDQLVVWLAVMSPRPNEIFAIRGADVGPNWIHIAHAFSRNRTLKETKNTKDKYIALGREVARRIHRWIAEHQIGPDDFLFTNPRNGRPVSRDVFLRRRLHPAAERARITTLDVDFQMLRRSYATLGHALGFDVKNIQAQMGHTRPNMALLEYVQPVDDIRRQQAQRMEDILLGEEPMPVDLTAKLGSRLVN